MISEKEPTTLQMIPLSLITERLPVRRLSPSGVARLKESIEQSGFLENFPLTVLRQDGGPFLLIDGNHRYEAALAAHLENVPCVVKTNLTQAECYTLALCCNRATEALVPSTLVTHAEFIWARLAEKDSSDKSIYTQMDVARMMGWGRTAVANYALLNDIDKKAWKIIVTTFEGSDSEANAGVVTPIGVPQAFLQTRSRSTTV